MRQLQLFIWSCSSSVDAATPAVLDDGRLEAVLEEVAAAVVAAVKGARVAAEGALQAAGERRLARAPQEVEMIGHEAPGVAGALTGTQDDGQPLEEVRTIGVVGEDGAPLDATSDDVMEGAGGLEAGTRGIANSTSNRTI